MSRRTDTTDVVVAGLGVTGSAVAYHLVRSGARVLGIDQHHPPHTLGSSHGRSRVIREAYFEHPSYVPLVRRAMELWRELEVASGRDLLRVTGALLIGRGESAVVRGSLRSAAEHAVPHERLDHLEIARRFPLLRADPECVAVFEPGAGALAAEACLTTLLEAAGSHGARLAFGEALIEWRPRSGGVEVVTTARRYTADALVLCAGPWLTRLEPQLPLRVERQVQLWFAASGLGAKHARDCPIFLCELPDGQVFYGLPDLGDGVKVARHHGGLELPLAEVRFEVDSQDVRQVRRFLARYLPQLDGEPVDGSVCLYTNTPDRHFLVDRHPQHPAVWLVSACSGHGFKFAPAIGEGVARWVTTGSAPADLAGFGLARLRS